MRERTSGNICIFRERLTMYALHFYPGVLSSQLARKGPALQLIALGK
jgi:hypothetical protein